MHIYDYRIKNFKNLIEYINAFPEQGRVVSQWIEVDGDNGGVRFKEESPIKHISFEKMSDLLPALLIHGAKDFLKSAEDGGLRHLILDKFRLLEVLKINPEWAAVLLNSKEGEDSLRHLIQNAKDLADVLSRLPVEKVPEVVRDLLEPEAKGGLRHLIKDKWQLIIILKVISKISPEVLSDLLGPQAKGGLRHLIQDADGLMGVLFQLPLEKVPSVVTDLLGREVDGGLRHLIKDEFDLPMLLGLIYKIAPDLVRDLLRLEAEGGLRHLIKEDWRLLKILECIFEKEPELVRNLLSPEEVGGLRHLIKDEGRLLTILSLIREVLPDVAVDLLGLQTRDANPLVRVIAINPESIKAFLCPKEGGDCFHFIPDGKSLLRILKLISTVAPDVVRVLLGSQAKAGLRHLIQDKEVLINILALMLKTDPDVVRDLLSSQVQGSLRHLIQDQETLINILAWISEKLPDVVTDLLGPEAEGGLRHLVKDGDDLKDVLLQLLLNKVPGVVRNLLGLQVDGGLRHLIKDEACLLSILELIVRKEPDLVVVLLKPEAKGGLRHLIKDIKRLVFILQLAPQLVEALFQPEAEDSLYPLVQDQDLLISIFTTSSKLIEDFLVFEKERGLRHLIKDGKTLIMILDLLLDAAPDVVRALLKPEKEGGLRHFVGVDSLVKILEVFPGWAEDLLRPEAEGGVLSEQLTLEEIILNLEAKDLLTVLRKNSNLFPLLKGWAYLFYKPEHRVEYCYAGLHYQVSQLTEHDVMTFYDYQHCLDDLKATVTSTKFERDEMWGFIDKYQKEPLNELLVATLLDDEECFHRLTDSAYSQDRRGRLLSARLLPSLPSFFVAKKDEEVPGEDELEEGVFGLMPIN